MTPSLGAAAPVAVSPRSHSTFAPPASARKPSRATSARLSRGANGGDSIGSLAVPLTRRPGAASCRHPSAKRRVEDHLGQAAGRVAGLNSAVKTVMRGMLSALASVMRQRAYARPARLARRDGGGG
jgi:hypothetical protein